MGAGKSTTGRRLATMLKVPFVDVDLEIERERGPIAAIFECEGEEAFRRYEREMLERVSRAGPAVIAVGGGAVLAVANRTLLRRQGYIVHLHVSADAAFERVAHRRHRPLLGERPDLQTIRRLLAARRAAYADNDFAITTGGRQAAAIARAIARWYRGKLRAAANAAGDG